MVELVPAAKLLHPAAACTVNVDAVELADGALAEPTVNQAAAGFVVVSMVKGVPPVAAEVTEIVCARPGVYVNPDFVQNTVAAGADRPEVVDVAVTFTVIAMSLVPFCLI